MNGMIYRTLFLLLFVSPVFLQANPGERPTDPYPWSSHPMETLIRSRTTKEFQDTITFCSERLDPEKYTRVVRAFGTVAWFLDGKRGWSDPANNRAAVDGLSFQELVFRAERAERTGVLRLPGKKTARFSTSPGRL